MLNSCLLRRNHNEISGYIKRTRLDNMGGICYFLGGFYNFTFWSWELVYFGYNMTSKDEKIKSGIEKALVSVNAGSGAFVHSTGSKLWSFQGDVKNNLLSS